MTATDDVFGALSDGTRRAILEELTERDEQTLFELYTRLAADHDVDMTRQGVSNHLEVLEEAGLVASTHRGKYRILAFAGSERIDAATAWLERLTENDTDTERT